MFETNTNFYAFKEKNTICTVQRQKDVDPIADMRMRPLARFLYDFKIALIREIYFH